MKRCFWLLFPLLILFTGTGSAEPLAGVAGIYTGQRIERFDYPDHFIRRYEEISIYAEDGSFWTRLERNDGEVFIMTGNLTFDSSGAWISNQGPHFRADLRGNALIVYVDWHRYGFPAVVQSMTHRVDTLPPF
jgi:hypothetical protein